MGTILVANLITVPISHLLISMKSAERGEFTKVKYKPFLMSFVIFLKAIINCLIRSACY